MAVHVLQNSDYPASMLTPWQQIIYGEFAFAAVFTATDPETAARTGAGKVHLRTSRWGVIAVIIRPQQRLSRRGAMLAVLLMNVFAR